MGKVKELLTKLRKYYDEKKETTANNYAINYYTNATNDTRGRNMTVLFDNDGGLYYFVSKAGRHDTFSHAAGIIAGQQDILIEDAKDCVDLSKFGYVIVAAEPGITNGNTTIYIPEEISEKQQERIDSFEAQVEKCNTEHNRRIQITKVVANENEKTL